MIVNRFSEDLKHFKTKKKKKDLKHFSESNGDKVIENNLIASYSSRKLVFIPTTLISYCFILQNFERVPLPRINNYSFHGFIYC